MPKVVELVDGGARWLLLPALPLSDPGQVTSRPSPRFPHLQNEMTGHSDVKSPFRTPRPRDCVTGTRKVIQPQTNLVGGTASWAPRFRTLLPSCPHAHLSLSKPCKISFCKSHPLFVLFSNSELQKPFLFPVKALPPHSAGFLLQHGPAGRWLPALWCLPSISHRTCPFPTVREWLC